MKPNSKLILLHLFFLFAFVDAHSQNDNLQEPIGLFSSNKFELAPSQIKVFRDDMSGKGINEILEVPASEYLQLEEISYFDKSKPHWATFALANETGDLMKFVIQGGRNSKETYYFLNSRGSIIEKKTGYFTPLVERDIRQNYFNKVGITIHPSEEIRVFVKIESLDNLPTDIRFTITPLETWERAQLQSNIFEGFFSGILVIFIVLSIFFYSTTKQVVFLNLSAYAALTLIYFAHVHGITELLFVQNKANALPPLWLTPLLIASAYFHFAKSYNQTKDFLPKWDTLFNRLSVFCVILFAVGSGYLYLTNDYYVTVNAMHIVLSALIFLGIVFLFIIYQKGTVINKYFVYGSMFFLFSGLISIAGQFFYISNTLPIFVQVGLVIEVLVFSLGMSYRSKKEYEEHDITQRSLILQLQQNDRLKENINNKLREEVAQRTQELRIKNGELVEAKDTAEKATASKSEFLSVMSHEIRTPLNAIISLSHIMEIDNKEKELTEYIDALKFSAENLHSLINDVLDYNKIEANKLRLEKVEFSLIDLLRNISEIFKYKAKRKGIELRIEIGEHTPDRLIGDPTRLTQIFNNLLSNAIKFTKEGHVTLKVYLSGVQDDKAIIHFDVIDTGIGIPHDKLELIFTEFEQANNSTTREFGGTGLGLSITKKLLQLMGSDIHVDIERKEGSKFSFEIPFVINKSFNIFSYGDVHAERNLENAKVLVVDDNDMNRLVLKRLLTIWKATFEEAASGLEAVEFCEAMKFDLILMDIEMRPINAFEAFSRIKVPENPNLETPIIAMSAYQTEEFSHDINATGFVSFVHKPFDPDELYEKMIYQLSQQNV